MEYMRHLQHRTVIITRTVGASPLTWRTRPSGRASEKPASIVTQCHRAICIHTCTPVSASKLHAITAGREAAYQQIPSLGHRSDSNAGHLQQPHPPPDDVWQRDHFPPSSCLSFCERACNHSSCEHHTNAEVKGEQRLATRPVAVCFGVACSRCHGSRHCSKG